jgi:TonB family protein
VVGIIKALGCVLMGLLILSCPARKDLLVPVLLDYQLDYPDEARRQGMEGTVNVRVLVNRSGRTEEVAIVKSSGNLLLDSAAVRTARTFLFSPAVVGENEAQAWVMVPIEFKFREVDNVEWLTQVEVLQQRIQKTDDEGAIEELYEMYRQMIFSPWDVRDIAFNQYIRDVVTERAARVWDNSWALYPARVVLFVDIINRCPDSFTALKARADLNRFLEQEAVNMRRHLGEDRADILIARIKEAIEIQ